MHLLKYVAEQIIKVCSIAAKESSEYVIGIEIVSIEACVRAASSERFLRPESVVACPTLRIAQASVSLA